VLNTSLVINQLIIEQ